MTEQEIFDTVLEHLRKQGEAATDGNACCYRSKSGLMCAVGCLITDEEYNPEMEGKDVRQIDLPERLSGNISFLEALQTAHDDALSDWGLDEWEDYMSRIAMRYNLTYTPPGETK